MTTQNLNTEATLTREERQALIIAWRAAHKTQDAEGQLLYALLRDKCPKRAFSPIKSAQKLAHGHRTWEGLAVAAQHLRWCLSNRLKQLLPTLALDRHEALVARLEAQRQPLAKLD